LNFYNKLAARTGLKQSAIARMENQGSLPRVDTLLKIAQVLDMELDFIPKKHQPVDTLKKMAVKIDLMENSITELIKVINKLQSQNQQSQVCLTN
jgi:transcriptional regulator with XRE-family HTH domain